jgi:excisionase family DNA binding protein
MHDERERITEDHGERTPELLTISEAALVLRISASMVRKITADGRLPCVQIGARTLYRRSDLVAFVDALAAPRRP